MKTIRLSAIQWYLPLVLAVGCGSVARVTVMPAFDPAKHSRVVVLAGGAPLVATWRPGPPISSGADEVAANYFATAMLATGRFRVVERTRLDRLLAEHDLTQSDVVARGEFKKAGRILGVGAIIIVRIDEIMGVMTTTLGNPLSRVSFGCHCVDVETGEYVWSIAAADKSYWSSDSIGLCKDLIDTAVGKLVSELPEAKRTHRRGLR